MSNLLAVYESMKAAEAQEMQKEASAKVNEQVADEQMEFVAKYAGLADEALAAEYGNEYTKEDVIKLAQLMIAHDVEVDEQVEKVAELRQAGRIIAEEFIETIRSAQ